jgi:hypothetical protein
MPTRWLERIQTKRTILIFPSAKVDLVYYFILQRMNQEEWYSV